MTDEAPAPEGPLLVEAAREAFGKHVRACIVCRVPTAPLCKKGAGLYAKLRELAEPPK